MSGSVFHYRLQPLLEEKGRKKEDAERKLAQRQSELREERNRLEDLERQETELVQRKSELRNGLLAARPGQPLTGDLVRRRADGVKLMDEQVEQARDAVFSQQIAIEDAEERLQAARRGVVEATREYETLQKHREKDEESFRREAERKEALEQDEIGSLLYETRRRQA